MVQDGQPQGPLRLEEVPVDSHCSGRRDCLVAGTADFSLGDVQLATAVKAGMKQATASRPGPMVLHWLEKHIRDFLERR